VNRTELVESVAAEVGIDKKQADAAVNAALGTIVSEIKAGNRVTIFGFGTFNPKSNRARMGRNPRTNEPMRLAASKGVSFKAATAFKEALQSKKAAPKKTAAKKTAAKKASASKAPAKKASASKATTTKKSSAKKATAAKKR
jgi:DNA-binding protein HU-beta